MLRHATLKNLYIFNRKYSSIWHNYHCEPPSPLSSQSPPFITATITLIFSSIITIWIIVVTLIFLDGATFTSNINHYHYYKSISKTNFVITISSDFLSLYSIRSLLLTSTLLFVIVTVIINRHDQPPPSS